MATISGRFAENPAYVKYELLLKQLHQLIALGDGDSADADALREAMEEPEQFLSRSEIIRLNGLSADLYMLQGAEILQPIGGKPLETQSLRSLIQEAQQWNDWESVLGLLRRRAENVPQEAVALARARAYDALGHPDTALLFLDHGAKLAPSDSMYPVLRLMILAGTTRLTEVVRDAEAIIQSKSASPLSRIIAVDVLMTAGRTRNEAFPAPNDAALLLGAVDHALRRPDALSSVPPDALVLAHVLRVGCLEALGRMDDAVRACDDALRYSPSDQLLREYRTLLTTIPVKPSDGPLRMLLDEVRLAAHNQLWIPAAAA